MLEKRGLSAVVTTMVIIFLALVSTGIVWGVIKTIISSGTEQISLGGFTTDLQIKKALVEDDSISIDVKRNPGGGDITALKFIFESSTSSQIIEEEVALKELEQRNFIFYSAELAISNITRVSVIPVYESDGKGKLGNVADTFEFKEGTMFETIEGNFVALGFKGVGREEYTLSSQAEDIVKFSRLIVDPLDVLPGDNQTFTVFVSSPYGITEVTTETQLDNELLVLPLELQPDGSWSATWIVYDTHTIEYTTKFIAKDSQGNEGSATLTWTDSCQSQITHGAPESVISSPCTTGASSIGGVDGGDLRIDADLTIDSASTFIFNQGYSIISGSGSIISTSTGSFGNGLLYYTDGDGDGYASGTTLALSGDIRAKDASGTSDCNDGNDYIFQTLTVATDEDRDLYYIGSLSSQCVGGKEDSWYREGTYGVYNRITSGDALGGNDCWDVDDRVYPDNPNWYYSNVQIDRTSWDYNCDTVATQQYPTPTGGGCTSCIEDPPTLCSFSGGKTGWSGAAPACGVSKTYYTDKGHCASPEPPCSTAGCTSESRQQGCH